MFGSKKQQSKKSEDVKKSAAKVLDPKKDTPTRSKHLRIFLDNADQPHETALFFENHYSHVFYIVYDAFVGAELNLRQKGAHKAQREELESVLYLLEKVLIYLPEHLGRKWQYHAMGRLMSKLLHPGNSWKLIKREAMRLFLLWYQILGDGAGDHLHAMFATLVPGFPSPYQGLGLTALAALTPDTCEGPVNPAEICPLIPPQSGERWRGINSPETDLTRIFLDVLLELMVSQVPLIEWKDTVKTDRQLHCLNFLFERFKMYYMPHIFPDFNWSTSLYRPSLELPDTRRFRPAFVDSGDGTKKMDPMLACRVVVIKWVAQYTHVTRTNTGSGGALNNVTTSPNNGLSAENNNSYDGSPGNATLNMSTGTLMGNDSDNRNNFLSDSDTSFEGGMGFGIMGLGKNSIEANLVREILYANRNNVNFVHEVYRQAFLLSFNHSPAIKKVITVYKDWIQMNVPELPAFLLEPLQPERDDYCSNVNSNGPTIEDTTDTSSYMMRQKQALSNEGDSAYLGILKEQVGVRAGLQNVLQIFVTNASNVFLLEVSAEYPILLEEQVEMCKRVLNIYRYMVMNVKMEARTWEQLLFILLQITQLTLPETPPRRREDTLGGRLAQAIFQTLIVTWIKANLYVVVSTELWDQFLDVLSSLTLWEELVREWAKTMETLTRVLARQVYNLDLNDLPLDRLNERAQKKRRGKQGPQELKYSNVIKQNESGIDSGTNVAPVRLPQSPVATTQGLGIGNNQQIINRNGISHDPSIETADSGNNSIIGPSAQSATGSHIASDISGRNRLISENSETQKFSGHCFSGKVSSGRRYRYNRHTAHHRHHRHSSSSNQGNPYNRNVKRAKLQRSFSDVGCTMQFSNNNPSTLNYAKRGIDRNRSRSLDSVLRSYSCDEESEICSRSCSPAPSSGLDPYACDRGSMKDSPMNQLMYGADPDTISEGGSIASDMLGDTSGVAHTGLVGLHGGAYGTVGGTGIGLSGNSITSTSTINQPRSVMGGGTIKGWLPDVAVVLWRRMLGSLGNINAIGDTVIHAQIYKYLIELFDIMVKIRSNQGVSLDNMCTPSSPEFVPPFTIFAPWCFRALNLPDSYARGRNYALRLLCLLTCRSHDAPLPKTHIVQFFKVLHNGLTGGASYGGGPIGFSGASVPKMDTMNTLIRFTGPRFFSIMLPGYTAYILDFLYAANCIISTSELKGVPRTEATSIVGTLLAFPPIVKDLPLLVPNPHCLELISSADVKDQIVGVLLKSGKKEPAGLARCISLSSLGIFVYSELLHESFHPKIKEAIQVLLTALRFNNKAVAQIASDMLLLLADHVKNFLEYYPEVPKKIVEVLARTLITLSPGGQQLNQSTQSHRPLPIPTDDEKRLLLSLLFCLGEWVMRVPRGILTQSIDNEGRTLLHHVFNALLIASCEPPGPTAAQVAASMHHAAEQQQMRRDGRDHAISAASPFSKSRVTGEPMGPAVMMTDFDPNIHVDNTKDNYNVANSNLSPLKTASKKGFTSSKNEIMENITKSALAAAGQAVTDNLHSSSPVPDNINSSFHHSDEQEAQNRIDGFANNLSTSDIELDDIRRNCPIRLASKTLMSHLVNHLFHFPMGPGGAASLSSMVNEQDDNHHYSHTNSSTSQQNNDELSPEIFKAPNVQLLVMNDTTLMSLVELPNMLESSSSDGLQSSQQSSNNSLDNYYHDREISIVPTAGLDNMKSQVRIIFRDISGKFSWDINPLLQCSTSRASTRDTLCLEPSDQQQNWLSQMADEHSVDDVSYSSVMTSQKTIVTVTSHSNRTTALLRHRDAATLPTAADTADDLDNLDDLLQHIGHTSPECLQEVGKPLNTIPSSNFLDNQVEKSSISGVLSQRNIEVDHVNKEWNQIPHLSFEDIEMSGKSTPTSIITPTPSNGDDELTVKALENGRNFQQARKLFSQLGFTSWERRPNIHLLAKSDQLLREIKHLDGKRGREAHKIAVIYVAEGQEDKQSILSNSSGSTAYEEFVSGLGWEVELDSHNGYMGGLVLGKGGKNKSTVGETSVYYATSFVEVMFHVSTRMPSTSEESMLSKTRHIGNDEVHVVWSEHWRDYRRGILPTEFCDVLIIVYPLRNTVGTNGCPRLHRVQVSRKPDVPYFGPLFNEAIVDGRILPGLIRATAINASRAKRSMLSHYRTHYEERYSALSNIVSKHKSKTSFEEYVTQVFSPAPLSNLYTTSDIPGTGSYRSFTSTRGHPSPRSSSVASSTSTSHLSTSPNDGEPTSQPSTTKSTSALLRPRTKTMAEFQVSQSSLNHGKSSSEAMRSSMNLTDRMTERDSQIPLHLAEDSTSPRNLKKLTATFKDKLNLNNNLSSNSSTNLSSGQASSPTIINQRTKKN